MTTPQLSKDDLSYMLQAMQARDCTLTPYWESRVRLLIEELRELRETRHRAAMVDIAAERAWHHGYELDPADVLETLRGEAP